MSLEVTSNPNPEDEAQIIEGTRGFNLKHMPKDFKPHCIFDRLIDAVLGVLKKYRPAFFEHDNTDEIDKWRSLESRWRSIKPRDIPEITEKWPESPPLRLLRLK